MFVIVYSPVRIDFAGGWTDVINFTRHYPGAVLNVALQTYSSAHFYVEDGDGEVTIISDDLGESWKGEVGQIEKKGTLKLLKAAVGKFCLEEKNLKLVTRSQAPPGSGLGSSASMGVSLVAGLSLVKYGRIYDKGSIAEEAYKLETEELGLISGRQDQYAAAYGGLNFMTFLKDVVELKRLDTVVNRKFLENLENRLVLFYTGKSRLSSGIHEEVWTEGKMGVLQELERVAVKMKEAIYHENGEEIPYLLNENWELQKQLANSITNPDVEHYFDIAMANGALGGKACGAGGGGCLLFYTKDKEGLETALKEALPEEGRIMPVEFDYEGVRVELG